MDKAIIKEYLEKAEDRIDCKNLDSECLCQSACKNLTCETLALIQKALRELEK